jgi:hypothetical protein
MINRKDLLHYSKATEAAFEIGHQVGDIAQQLYAGGKGVPDAGDIPHPSALPNRMRLT